MSQHSRSALSSRVQLALDDVAACLRFFSRLPVPYPTDRPERPFADAVALLPIASLVIGCCGAVPLTLAMLLGLPGSIAVVLGGAGLIAATGGLHEDGLADTADGLGGGATRERKLAIMRDSHIGTYGVLAAVLALLLRFGALEALLERGGPLPTIAAMLGAAAVSRALALLPMAMLPPARPDGLGRAIGQPNRTALLTCAALAAGLGLMLPLAAGIAVLPTLAGCVAALGAGAAVVRLAHTHIGGHTGDIAGASQQAGEIAYLLGLLVLPGQS